MKVVGPVLFVGPQSPVVAKLGDTTLPAAVTSNEPQAMSVLELSIGGNPVQYAWVTLSTPSGAVVECYNFATSEKTTTLNIGSLEAIDMNTNVPDQPMSDAQTGFVHVLAVE